MASGGTIIKIKMEIGFGGNMGKILDFLKLCLHQKDPYPWGIYETTLINVPSEVLRELEEIVDNRRRQLTDEIS